MEEIEIQTWISNFIKYSLLEDAIFYSERLVASKPEFEGYKFILCSCLFRQREFSRIISILGNSKTWQCRYILSLSYEELGMFDEAEKCLYSMSMADMEDMSSIAPCLLNSIVILPNEDVRKIALGRIYRKQGKNTEAVQLAVSLMEDGNKSWQVARIITDNNVECKKPEQSVPRRSARFNDKAKLAKKMKQHVVGKENLDSNDKTEECCSSSHIHETLSLIAKGDRLLAQYKCTEAIKSFQLLPKNQFQTGYVLSKVGRACFELGLYEKAEMYYQKMMKVDPGYLSGLEVYSTLLWHLKKEKVLAALAKRLVNDHKLSPVSWCFMGNCFSLVKNPSEALECFQRCIQLDPQFVYAYTLSGHEWLSKDDSEKAIKFFRQALSIDPRHYNAWYGLGSVYSKQENFDLAKFNFKKAVDINPNNAILFCNLGLAMCSLGQVEDGIEQITKAESLDSSNPFIRFQKAKVLFNAEKYNDSLKSLNELVEYAPNEQSVFKLLSEVHEKLKDHETSLKYQLRAANLDSRNFKQREAQK